MEFARLLAFVDAVFESPLFENLRNTSSPETHPSGIVSRLWLQSPSRALRGLRDAVGDLVEATQDLEGAPLADLEACLARAGAPALATMRDRRRRSIFQILNRREIRSDEEWRVLEAVLSDTADRLLDPQAREAADTLLREYEQRVKP